MAVFTPVSEDAARAYLRAYDIGELEALDPIVEGVENTNYKMAAGGRRYVLTLFEKRVRADDLPQILTLIAHLSDAGYPAPRPVPQREGGLLGELCDRRATIIAWAAGAWLRDPSREEIFRAGAALADLHTLAADAPAMPPNRFALPAWRELAASCANAADRTQRSLVDELNATTDGLAARWPGDLPSGPIHGDYFPDNVLFNEGRVSGVIDFYFSCADAIAYDFAISLNAWCFDAKGGFLADASAAFSQGYVSRRPMSEAERAAMPLLCEGAAARFTLTRLHDLLYADVNAMVRLKDPVPFAERMRFHAQVTDPGVYGL